VKAGDVAKVVVACAAMVCAGCATIMHGGHQRVAINSSPAGARVLVKDEYGREVLKQQTPCVAVLKRGSGYFGGASYTVTVEKPGYESAGMAITPTLSGWYTVGNFFIGGLIGWLVVDPLSGGMWTLRPKAVNLSLPKRQAAATDERGASSPVAGKAPAGTRR